MQADDDNNDNDPAVAARARAGGAGGARKRKRAPPEAEEGELGQGGGEDADADDDDGDAYDYDYDDDDIDIDGDDDDDDDEEDDEDDDDEDDKYDDDDDDEDGDDDETENEEGEGSGGRRGGEMDGQAILVRGEEDARAGEEVAVAAGGPPPAGGGGALPPYVPDTPARLALDDPIFYASEAAAQTCAQLRESELGGATMGQLRQMHETRPSEFFALWSRIGVSFQDRVARLFPSTAGAVELLLQRMGPVLALNSEGEISRYKLLPPLPLPTLDQLFNDALAKGTQPTQDPNRAAVDGSSSSSSREGRNPTRGMPISLVLGASGAGKTYFGLQYLADHLWPRGLPIIAAYLKPAETGVAFGRRRRRSCQRGGSRRTRRLGPEAAPGDRRDGFSRHAPNAPLPPCGRGRRRKP
jgi:hypothetical protein